MKKIILWTAEIIVLSLVATVLTVTWNRVSGEQVSPAAVSVALVLLTRCWS